MKIKLMKELIEKLNSASYEYYKTGKTIMPDDTFDNLIEELKILEIETGVIMANSPTQNVGTSVVDSIDEIEHTHPMLSLDKVHSSNEIMDFIGDNEVVGMLKMDGLTVSLEYDNGKLTRLETRGNGRSGKNCIHLASAFDNIPLAINHDGVYTVDGEAIITYSDFELINEKIKNPDDKYKNPRNLAAGTLNLKDCAEAKGRHLKFIAWDVINDEKHINLSDSLQYAKSLGFEIVPCGFWKKDDLPTKEEIEEFNIKARQVAEKNGYPIDGVVFKYNNITYGKSLGRTEKFFKNAIAYKYEDDKYPTKLKDVIWQVGKTGAITPVIITEPVEIDGTTVERASVHNISIFKQLGLTKGCTCYLYKANQIIPQCDSAEWDGSDEITIPEVCPVCGGEVRIAQNNEAQVLMCMNSECPGKLLGRAKNFVSKKAMNIDGLSEATLEKFIDYGWINNLSDIYHLEEHFPELKKKSGFGKKSVDNLKAAIDQSKNVELKNFITSLSIKGIGEAQAKTIAKKFTSWKDFADAGMGTYDFSKLPGIAAVKNKDIHKWFKTMYFTDNIEEIASLMNFRSEVNETSKKTLSGKTFVITGTLTKYKNRNELVDIIEKFGGKVSGSVSSKTSYLINNDKQSSSSKNQKAQNLNIPIINEEDFAEMIG